MPDSLHLDTTCEMLTFQSTSRLKKALAIASMAINLQPFMITPHEVDPNSALIRSLPTAASTECAPVPSESIYFANKALQLDSTPRLMQLQKQYPQKDYYVEDNPYELRLSVNPIIHEKYKSEVAESLGLTLHTADLERLDADLFPKANIVRNPNVRRVPEAQLPFSIYFDQAKAFLTKYGVGLEIGQPDQSYGANLVAPPVRTLETYTAKRNLYNLISFFQEQPVELVELMGLKHIILTSTSSHPRKDISTAAAAAITGPPHDTILLNMSDLLTTKTYGHESGHILDAALCPPYSSNKDPGYLNLNGDSDYNVETRPASKDYESAQKRIDKLSSTAHRTDTTPMLAAQLETELLQLRGDITFISRAKNISEDKADMAAHFLNPDIPFAYDEIFNNQQPKLTAKSLYLLGRLAEYSPKIVTYFALVSRRRNVFSSQQSFVTAIDR